MTGGDSQPKRGLANSRHGPGKLCYAVYWVKGWLSARERWGSRATPVHLQSESPRRVDAATSRDISLGTWRRVTRLNLDLHPTSASWDPSTLVHRHIDVQQNILRPSIRPKIPSPLCGHVVPW